MLVAQRVVLYRRVDPEDLWVSGFTLPTEKKTFLEAFEEHRELLASQEIVSAVVYDCALDVPGELSFSRVDLKGRASVEFVFEKSDGETVSKIYGVDFITTFTTIS